MAKTVFGIPGVKEKDLAEKTSASPESGSPATPKTTTVSQDQAAGNVPMAQPVITNKPASATAPAASPESKPSPAKTVFGMPAMKLPVQQGTPQAGQQPKVQSAPAATQSTPAATQAQKAQFAEPQKEVFMKTMVAQTQPQPEQKLQEAHGAEKNIGTIPQKAISQEEAQSLTASQANTDLAESDENAPVKPLNLQTSGSSSGSTFVILGGLIVGGIIIIAALMFVASLIFN